MTALSKSPLWHEMYKYYHELGPKLWQEEIVPNLITTNTHIAKKYAELIIGFAKDTCINNIKKEIIIVEIGSGHGKFSYYLLNFLKTFALDDLKIKYIMTDISQDNLNSCIEHKALKPYIEAGILDFAFFNALEDSSLELQYSKQHLDFNAINSPVIFLANYIFDSLPHDCFKIKDHNLFELELNYDSNILKNSINMFENPNFSFQQNPTISDYYDNINLNKILQDYKDEFDEANFSIPVGGLKLINNAKNAIKAPILFLIADKAVANTDLFDNSETPDISLHGSVSMVVNFDALSRYLKYDNGISMLMDNSTAEFQVAAFAYPNDKKLDNTFYSFKTCLSEGTPQDIINLCYNEDEIVSDYNLTKIISLLNTACWDPNIFYDYHELILEIIEDTDDINIDEQANLILGMKKVWQNFFKLELNTNIPFAIGSILYHLDELEDAVFYLEKAVKEFGEDKETLFNLALVYVDLENKEKLNSCCQSLYKNFNNCNEVKSLLKDLNFSYKDIPEYI